MLLSKSHNLKSYKKHLEYQWLTTTNNLFSGGGSLHVSSLQLFKWKCRSRICQTENRGQAVEHSPWPGLQFWKMPGRYPSFSPGHSVVPQLFSSYHMIFDTWVEERNKCQLSSFHFSFNSFQFFPPDEELKSAYLPDMCLFKQYYPISNLKILRIKSFGIFMYLVLNLNAQIIFVWLPSQCIKVLKF